jgi:hypothetical protein
MPVSTAATPVLGHNSRQYGEDVPLAQGQSPSGQASADQQRFRARFKLHGIKNIQEVDLFARDERDARRRLRVMLGTPLLPADLEIQAVADLDQELAALRTKRARYLLRVLADHFRWLAGIGGARAELVNLDLTEVSLEGRDLTQANLRGSDLTGASLKRSRLTGADMAGAILKGADLRGADLTGADLSNADLRGALLIGAKMDGVDSWRANFAGAIISPEMLHQALACKRVIDRVGLDI